MFCTYVELGGSLYFTGHLSGYTLPYSQNVTCASFPTTPCYTDAFISFFRFVTVELRELAQV